MRAQVLVVEDDFNGRELMAALLHEMGHEVTTTADAEEALRYLTPKPHATPLWLTSLCRGCGETSLPGASEMRERDCRSFS
jgi:CheY-like chemotaxis protein